MYIINYHISLISHTFVGHKMIQFIKQQKYVVVTARQGQ